MDRPFLISQCYNEFILTKDFSVVVAPFLISQCYNGIDIARLNPLVVAPFLISQCYNQSNLPSFKISVVAPFLISQCYNSRNQLALDRYVVAPFLISQCYNTSTGNPYSIRVSRFILSKKNELRIIIVGLNLLFFLGFSAHPTAVSWWHIAFLLLPNSGLNLLAVGLHTACCGVFATNHGL